jgi:transcriptional regulator with XRE-family HTH domain
VEKNLELQFGRVLRARRQAAGLSQEALASAAGLARNYISLLEIGKKSPTLRSIQLLAAALDTTVTSLISAAEKKLENE